MSAAELERPRVSPSPDSAGARDGRPRLSPAVAMAMAMAVATVAAATACAGLMGGCAPASTPPRGFGSRQVVALRDPDLALGGFTEDGRGIYLAHGYTYNDGAGNEQRRSDISRLDLGSGVIEPLVTAATTAFLVANGSRPGRSLVVEHRPADALPVVSLIDETGVVPRLDIRGVVPFSLQFGATRADPMMIDRVDATGLRLWFGPPDQLVAAPAGLMRGAVAGLDARGAYGRRASTPAAAEQPATWSLAYFPFDGSPPTEIVPATLGEHRVVGGDATPLPAPGPAPIDPSSWTDLLCARGLTAGAGPRCYLIYGRRLSDDEPRLFVRYLDDPVEVMLPGISKLDVPIVAPDGGALNWVATAASGLESQLFTWTVGAPTAGSCAVGGTGHNRTLWFGGEAGAARFVTAVVGGGTALVANTVTLSFGTTGAGCVTQPVGDVLFLEAAPAGDRVAWIDSDPEGKVRLHLGDAEGSSERVVASGAPFVATSFLDDSRLLAWRSATDGQGLSWLDLAVDPAVEHPVGERVFAISWVSPSWVLLGSGYSAQDDNGTLALTNIETGAERPISRLVTSVSPRWRAPSRAAAPAADRGDMAVAYLVRGRVASAQDGVWLAELPLAELAASAR